jgi:hypothetical protein
MVEKGLPRIGKEEGGKIGENWRGSAPARFDAQGSVALFALAGCSPSLEGSTYPTQIANGAGSCWGGASKVK